MNTTKKDSMHIVWKKLKKPVYIENGNKLNKRKQEELRIGPFPKKEQFMKQVTKGRINFCVHH